MSNIEVGFRMVNSGRVFVVNSFSCCLEEHIVLRSLFTLQEHPALLESGSLISGQQTGKEN